MPCGAKAFLKPAAAVVACLLTGTCVFLMHASAFAGGKSTYYLYSASSQAEIKESLKPAELVGLKGESAVYVFENGEAGADAAFVERILDEYRAKICFVEEAAGTLSYYCYSPRLKNGVLLEGRKINLHIAVRAESIALGTPIIFGGY